MHLADERHGVSDALVPAGVAPCALACLATGLQVLVAWRGRSGTRVEITLHILQPYPYSNFYKKIFFLLDIFVIFETLVKP